MNRRDTLIIVALLNAGLLIFLFATHLKTEKVDLAHQETVQMLASSTQDEATLSPVSNSSTVIGIGTDTTHPSSDTLMEEIGKEMKQYIAPPIKEQFPLTSLETTPSAPSSKTPSDELFKEITIKKGDTLEKIAKTEAVTLRELMKVNQLVSTHLRAGQTLKIPRHKNPTNTANESGSFQYYTVKSGDSPWTIATKHGIKVEDLLKLNHLSEEKAKKLRPGEKLRIH